MSYTRHGLLLLLAGAMLLSAGPAGAATFVVTKVADTNDGTCDGDCSLREAIIAANANAGADTVTWLGAGGCVLSIAGTGEDAAATGDLDITGDLEIVGMGVISTIVDGAGLDRVFDILSGSVQILALTIKSGSADYGGGILIRNGGTLTLADSAVSGNSATSSHGGGIYSYGTLAVTTSTIIGNTAGPDGNGAGICTAVGTTTTIESSTISENTMITGGGIANGGTMQIATAPSAAIT